MRILGLSAFYHDSAACLLRNGEVMAAAQEAVRAERKIGFVLQQDPDLQSPTGRDLHKVGTVASIVRYVTSQDGTHHLVVQGERRFRVLDWQDSLPFMVARVEYLADSATTSEIEARSLHLLGAEALHDAHARHGLLDDAGVPPLSLTLDANVMKEWQTAARSGALPRPGAVPRAHSPLCADDVMAWVTPAIFKPGDAEADIKSGLISVSSPIARALVGKSKGDVVDVVAPNGTKSYEIVGVRYI